MELITLNNKNHVSIHVFITKYLQRHSCCLYSREISKNHVSPLKGFFHQFLVAILGTRLVYDK